MRKLKESQRTLQVAGAISAALFLLAGCQALPPVSNNASSPGPTVAPTISPPPPQPDPTLQNDGLDDALQELEAVE